MPCLRAVLAVFYASCCRASPFDQVHFRHAVRPSMSLHSSRYSRSLSLLSRLVFQNGPSFNAPHCVHRVIPFLFCFPYIISPEHRAERRGVRLVKNGYTLEPQSYPSSRKPNLRLAGPGIHVRTGHAWGNTDSDVCVQYALPDQGPVGAGS